MALERRAALALFGRALLWLPACLVAWYLVAPATTWFAANLARPAVRMAAGPVTELRLAGRDVSLAVSLDEPYVSGRDSRQAVVDLEVKASAYTFGIALFLALALAARESRRIVPIALGVLVLAVLPAWSIAFDVLRQLAADPQLAPFLAWNGAAREIVALGYQVGSLLLPTLAPVVLWLALTRPMWMPEAAPAAR